MALILDTVNSQATFDVLHDKWYRERIDFFATYPRTAREFIFTYGHTQKRLNMTMKYLAVFNHPSVRHVYPYLYVPIDAIIYNQADQIGAPRPPGRTSWSRLNRGQYLTYQTQLRTDITQQTTHSGPMDWEPAAWVPRNSAIEN